MIIHISKSLCRKSGAGFTLIETLIYVVFLCIILSTMLGIVYQTLQATDQINKKIVMETEADFLLAKINWALTGAGAVVLPTVGSSGSQLQVNKFNYGQNPVTLQLQNGFLQLQLGVAAALNLNSQNVTVSNFSVVASQVSGQPQEARVNFSLQNTGNAAGSQDFQIIKYLR